MIIGNVQAVTITRRHLVGDSEWVFTDMEEDTVAKDVNGKPVDVVGQSTSDTKSYLNHVLSNIN